MHIIKGAIVKVFNTPVTTTVNASKPTEGRIAVEWGTDQKVPTEAELRRVEKLANDIIQANVEVTVTEMSRKEAEDKYRNNLVNSTFIYDKFPVPASVQRVNVLEIKDWNVNCCVGTHLKTTGQVRFIKVSEVPF